MASHEEIVFHTPWFDILAKNSGSDGEPHYTLSTLDYVTVIAITAADEILLVRQYRPAVGVYTIELPSGHVELGQTPEAAAAAELSEETGYGGDSFELLGKRYSDTGRMANNLWCFGVRDVMPVADLVPEAGIEVVTCPRRDFADWVRTGKVNNALAYAALTLAELQGWQLLRSTADG